MIVLDLRALRAPYTADDADVWELVLTRAKAAHVDSVVVDGRVLMLERRLQHIDRDALMDEVAVGGGVGGREAHRAGARPDRAAAPADRRALPGTGVARGPC